MKYLMKADNGSLYSLAKIFSDVCAKSNIQVGQIQATFLLLSIIDEAKKAELFVPVETQAAEVVKKA